MWCQYSCSRSVGAVVTLCPPRSLASPHPTHLPDLPRSLHVRLCCLLLLVRRCEQCHVADFQAVNDWVPSYMYNGQNYLLKMVSDGDILSNCQPLQSVLGPDFKLRRNPLLLSKEAKAQVMHPFNRLSFILQYVAPISTTCTPGVISELLLVLILSISPSCTLVADTAAAQGQRRWQGLGCRHGRLHPGVLSGFPHGGSFCQQLRRHPEHARRCLFHWHLWGGARLPDGLHTGQPR